MMLCVNFLANNKKLTTNNTVNIILTNPIVIYIGVDIDR